MEGVEMKATTKKLSIWLSLGALLTGFALSGCNTVRGLGQDIGKAGDQLEESAREEQAD